MKLLKAKSIPSWEGKWWFLRNIIWLFIFFSCSNPNTKEHIQSSDTTVCDSYNRKVTFKENPGRIISAAPGITEIIFALGEGKRLVARTDYCDFPPQVKDIRSIGGIEDPSIETIATINPDLIIASTHFQKEMVDKIQQLSIPIVVLKNQESFNGAYELIKSIAAILNVMPRADSIIDKMKREVKEVENEVNKLQYRPKVYFVIGFGKTGDYTAGGDTFINQLIELSGGNNIASDVKGWAYSIEMLIKKDPDIILIRTGDKDLFCKTAGYSNLKAVKNGKIFEINNNLFEITGPRLGEGLKILYKILHTGN